MRNSKNLILALVFAAFMSSPAFASVGVKINGTPKGALENVNFTTPATADIATATGVTRNVAVADSSLFITGVANGGATSLASTTTAIPTGFAFVRKVLSSTLADAFQVGTLANGKPNQILTIQIVGTSPANTAGAYVLSPTTTTGFQSIKFTAIGDRAVFQFIDATTGWVLLDFGGSVTVTLKN